MSEGLMNNERKEWARVLYTRLGYNIKDTALEVNADETTVRNWVNESAWDGVRKSLLISKTTQLENLYRLLETLYSKIQTSGDANLKDADLCIKYTAAIKNLEAATPVVDIIDVAELFMKWLRHKDLELAKKVVLPLDAFIREKISPLSS